ncbi:MAG: chromosomal replication initiator protein DnaA [Parcubacteria group bacterium]
MASISPIDLWKIVLSEMELSLSKANFATWFKGTSLLSIEINTIVISVPSNFIREWLEKKFNKQILSIVRKHQPGVREMKYVIGTAGFKPATHKKEFVQLMPESEMKEPLIGNVNTATNLNTRYAFDTFIVGPNNELAHAACMSITKRPGTLYNPLFLYGGVGLGKTHLLQSTGNSIAQKYPEKKIHYIPAERLTAEIIESLRSRTTENLKQRYYSQDVLIVDDIQFISGKTTTQEIFFGIFNELYSRGKQVILSSDRPPSTMAALEERLRSRFEGGMIADIGPPEYETRLAIVKLKIKELEFTLEEESMAYIASHIQKNIRELEGALKKISAFRQFYDREPSQKEIKQLLGVYLHSTYRKPTPQTVIKSVADFYKINTTDLIKRSRRKEVVRPRQIAMFLLREEIKYSFPEIGTRLGGRDHSTVIHACAKIKDEELNNDTTRQELNLIKERIYQSFDNA